MTDQYYILYYSGAGGFFLASVLLRMFGLPIKKNNIAPNGSCHDMGAGDHQSTDHHGAIGWRWLDKEKEYSNKFCISGHYSDLHMVKQMYPDIKVVLIQVDNDDQPAMASMRLYKTTIHSYPKLVKQFGITDWPPLYEVIEAPELIKESFIKYDKHWFEEWNANIDFDLVDIVIPFKTLFGLDKTRLEVVLQENFQREVDADTTQFIKTYQEKNMEYITS